MVFSGFIVGLLGFLLCLAVIWPMVLWCSLGWFWNASRSNLIFLGLGDFHSTSILMTSPGIWVHSLLHQECETFDIEAPDWTIHIGLDLNQAFLGFGILADLGIRYFASSLPQAQSSPNGLGWTKGLNCAEKGPCRMSKAHVAGMMKLTEFGAQEDQSN